MTRTLTHGFGQDLLASWKRAWEARDPDAFVALFADDAELRLDPFAEPAHGSLAIRAHWNAFVADTINTEFDAERIWVTDDVVLASWHGASTDRRTAQRTRLRGFLTLELGADGTVARARAWPTTRVVGLDASVKPEPRPGDAQEGA